MYDEEKRDEKVQIIEQSGRESDEEFEDVADLSEEEEFEEENGEKSQEDGIDAQMGQPEGSANQVADDRNANLVSSRPVASTSNAANASSAVQIPSGTRLFVTNRNLIQSQKVCPHCVPR